jgi:ABC-type uncharacterized transport system involved in gliding motility auxiliary subunit
VGVLLQGRLESYFPAPVELSSGDSSGDGEGAEAPAGSGSGAANPVERFRRSGVEPADIIVLSASALTTAQMIDPSGRTPNGTLLLNAVDYLNGAPGMAELRSKGLGVARLGEVSPVLRRVTRWSNTILVPALVLIVGVVVWMKRRARSRSIHAIFAVPTEEKK